MDENDFIFCILHKSQGLVAEKRETVADVK